MTAVKVKVGSDPAADVNRVRACKWPDMEIFKIYGNLAA
jgi:hypothetical protein